MNHQNQPSKQVPPHHSIELKQTHIKGEIFQSNYPPPEMLEKYAQLDPTFPDRLLKMAEAEGNHRRRMEKRITGWSIFLDLLGTILAPTVVAGVLYVGYWFMKNDHANEGAWVIGTVTVAIAVAFLTRGKKNNNKSK